MQNGIVERKNRTLVEAARYMSTESGLPTGILFEAVAIANHVRNRCLTKVLGTKTPFEIWTGGRPNLKYLQKFEAKVYILDKSPNKEKFSQKGSKELSSDTLRRLRPIEFGCHLR